MSDSAPPFLSVWEIDIICDWLTSGQSPFTSSFPVCLQSSAAESKREMFSDMSPANILWYNILFKSGLYVSLFQAGKFAWLLWCHSVPRWFRSLGLAAKSTTNQVEERKTTKNVRRASGFIKHSAGKQTKQRRHRERETEEDKTSVSWLPDNFTIHSPVCSGSLMWLLSCSGFLHQDVNHVC